MPTDNYKMFVGGEFRPASGGERIEVEYPYNGEIWATVPRGTEEDVETAVSEAKEAFSQWKETKPTERAEVLRQIASVFDSHAEELGELETRQNGKKIGAMQGQMKRIVDWFEYFASLCGKDEGEVKSVERKDGQVFNYTRHEPYGIVGAITPWNSPLLLSMWKLAPALATGNTFVHKPSEQTPVSALRLAELIYEETDLPAGVYNVVPGDGTTGQTVTNNDEIDKLAFTGSTAVGREIAKTAGEQLIPVTLELGGKSPNIVFPSADMENAVDGVMKGVFAATGQTCMAGSRVFLHESIADQFVDRLVEKTETLTLGDPMAPETEVGPVAFEGQHEKIMEYIDTGKEEGVTVACGGRQPEDESGYFVEPTVLLDADNDMQVARDEIFGPVMSVIEFSDEKEVVRLANDTPYGLAAGVWTEDMRQAFMLSEQIEAGTVWINEYRLTNYSTPFGGYKDSGLGRENGTEVLDEYRQVKSVWFDLKGEVTGKLSDD